MTTTNESREAIVPEALSPKEIKSNKAWRLECEELRRRHTELQRQLATVEARVRELEAELAESKRMHKEDFDKLTDYVREYGKLESALAAAKKEDDK